MIQELFDLKDKVALVTGGTHGIGMAVGTVLGKAGAKVCVNGRDELKLKAAKEEYAANGIDVFTIKFDVTDEADVD
ncbi:MAG: SDR family NAD(P)-dependent oxidoreductase, partial [Kiritimatiellaceae bacterium]|nr:SDR family NAD(P)-dependent oxidoreductase [Kiritimatiellaceae bacterium]